MSFKKFIKTNWHKYLIVILIAGFTFFYLHYSETGNYPISLQNLPQIVAFLMAGFVMNFILTKISFFLNKKVPWYSGLIKRFAVELLTSNLSSIFVYFIISGVFINLFFPTLGINSFINSHLNSCSKLLILNFLYLMIYTLISFNLYSYKQYDKEMVDSERLKSNNLQMQYNVLRSQLSPHYLFNSLNTISSLIDKSSEKAELYIRKFASTFDFILENNDKRLITLKEELCFLESYVFLLKVRYEDALFVKIDIHDQVLHTYIPPLSLQILTENAVKHNPVSDETPLSVFITSKNNMICISNNKIEHDEYKSAQQNQNKVSHKIGLSNIKQRYGFYTTKLVQINNNGDKFIVKLPVIKL